MLGMGVMEFTNLDSQASLHPGVPVTPLQEMIVETEQNVRSLLKVFDSLPIFLSKSLILFLSVSLYIYLI